MQSLTKTSKIKAIVNLKPKKKKKNILIDGKNDSEDSDS